MKEEARHKEELRLNREIAYKRTMEKDIENIRERLEFVTKEYYTYKNEVTPVQKEHTTDIRYMKESIQTITKRNYDLKQKLDILEPILQIKMDDRDLRRNLTDYMMNEWRDRFSEAYMTVDQLNRVFEEQKEKHKEHYREINNVVKEIRNIERTYILKKEVESLLVNYAEKEMAEQLEAQMKQVPTNQNL